MPNKCAVTASTWDRATDLFELGHCNGRQIADALGVSPQTVMREMRRRGAIHGSRVHETVAPLNARIDEKQRRAALRRAEADRKAIARTTATMEFLDAMMKALVAADQRGDLASAAGMLDQVGSALGVSTSPRSRRR